jgi:hypothetical protein
LSQPDGQYSSVEGSQGPTLGEDVERDHTTNGESKVEVGKLGTELLDESSANLVNLVVLLKLGTLLVAACQACQRVQLTKRYGR